VTAVGDTPGVDHQRQRPGKPAAGEHGGGDLVEVLAGEPAGRPAPAPGQVARTLRLPPGLTARVAAFDRRVDAAVDRVRHPVLDRIMFAATELGDFSLVWHLVGTARGRRRRSSPPSRSS
jgi:hypothetical protein